jgi:hypothetical protein
MTVKELIEQLSAFDGELEVVTADYDGELEEIVHVLISDVCNEAGEVERQAVFIVFED